MPRTLLTSSYDASGRRTGLTATDPANSANDDFVNVFAYDAAGRTTQVTQTGQTGGRAVASKRVDLDYDDLGRRETLSRYADLAGTALVAATGYAFDLNGRLTGLEHKQGSTPFADYGYVFDTVGRLIEESTLAETRNYSYDAGGQLTAVDSSLAGRDENYAYDRTGNRTSNGGQAGTGNRLAEDANYTYQYDAEGNRSQRTSKADGSREIYWWDHRNRLIRVNFRTSANVLTQSVAYAYDAYDNLIRRQVDGNGDGTFEQSQSFVVDLGGKGGLDDVVLAFDESGNVEHRYLHGDGVDELWADESTTDGLLWALADRQGTVNDWAEHDAGTGTTTVTNHVEFDAYGNIVSQTNGSHEITAGGYTGRYHDPLTGLRYHRGRWTDPNTGWLNPDPGGFAMGDENLYRYVRNSPGNWVDPSGMAARPEYSLWNPTTWDWDWWNDVKKTTTGFGRTLGSAVDPRGLDPRNLVASLQEIPNDVEKAKTLWQNPGDYLGERRRVIAEGFQDKFSTPEGNGELIGYGTLTYCGVRPFIGPRGTPTGSAGAGSRPSTFQPGRYARESIPARSPSQRFTNAEYDAITDIGRRTGCHTCGTTNPGTTSGRFVPDHQPVSRLNCLGSPQRLYPHCISCSQQQGLDLLKMLREFR